MQQQDHSRDGQAIARSAKLDLAKPKSYFGRDRHH